MAEKVMSGDAGRLRAYRPGDLHAVRRLIHSTIDACYPAAYPAEAVAFFKAYHADETIAERAEQGRTVVLECGGRIVGTGTLINDGVTGLFVEPAFQGRGLGRRIMADLEAKARAAGLACIKLDASLPSKHFYDALGYCTVEEASRPVSNDKNLQYYRMHKTLDHGG